MHPRKVKPITLALRVVAISAVIALPVTAAAPADQYGFFTGAAVTIKDNFTRLEWQRPTGSTYPKRETFADATTLCSGSVRLPTLKELLTIVDEEPHLEYLEGPNQNEARYIDRFAFRNAPSGAFWSSSARASDGKHAYTVDFESGEVGLLDKTQTAYVRCVRSY